VPAPTAFKPWKRVQEQVSAQMRPLLYRRVEMSFVQSFRRFLGGSIPSADPPSGADAEQRRAVSNVLPEYSPPQKDQLYNFFMPVFWGTADDEAFAASAKSMVGAASSGHHFADNFLTWSRNMSMLEDQPFVKAWKSNAESPSDTAIVWRRYVLACAAYHCIQLDGDFVECGAYTGVGMKTVIDYLGATAFPKTFWGYDVFEHDESMANHPMPEHGPDLFVRVAAKFSEYPQVKLIRGLIPQVFEKDCPDRIAYLHIDLNQAPAEVAALDHLFDRMVPGAILILDDYEWSGAYRPQKLAEDDWFDRRCYRVMPLPTGQGLVFKR
jgi:O-methyltransferase